MADIEQSLLDAIADLRTAMERRFTAVDERLTTVDERLTTVDERLTTVDERLATVDERLATVDERLATLALVRAQLDGLPLINRAVTVVQQDVRALRAAFNDFALTNTTAGEIEALHQDVNRVQAENAEFGVKLATLERLVRELQER